MTRFSGSQLLEAAVSAVADAVRDIAERKKVSVSVQEHAVIARAALEKFHPRELRQLLVAKPDVIALAAKSINHAVDVIALSRILYLKAWAEGEDNPDLRLALAQAERGLDGAVANDGAESFRLWPEPMEAVRQYYAARRSGVKQPLGIKLPSGALRASVALGSQAKMAATPVVKTLPDGAAVTTYWLNGELHRDPEEGPAWHRKGPSGEHSEYVVHGRLHRDHQDGPAIIDTNWEGRAIVCEEYYEDGTWHRPAAEGPAITHTDRNGRHVLEIYVEHGESHRDPKHGPAWHAVEDGVERWEYRVRGKWHRDEEDGPALIMRDEASGVVLSEEYFSNGDPHREGGPCAILRDAAGKVISESWYRHGLMHRDPSNGPAYAFHDPDLGETREEFAWNGLTHRDPTVGPAVIVRDAGGRVIEEQSWRDGELIEERNADAAEAIDA